MKKVAIFVDGENFRYSLKDLFPRQFTYLPKKAKWSELFCSVLTEEHELIRIYWYVADFLDFRPYILPRLNDIEEIDNFEKILKKKFIFKSELDGLNNNEKRLSYIAGRAEEMRGRRNIIRKRFDGWKVFQTGISSKEKYIEFRRAGAICFDLLRDRFLKEKGVDINLAVDLLNFSEMCDIAIIFSGDQDYIPAINECKNRGKHVFAVNFETQNGKLLPGTAFRLKSACDEIKTIKYDELQNYIEQF